MENRRSFVMPIVLIGAGAVLLLNNVGVIQISLVRLLSQLWPLILVAVGVDLLLGRRGGIWQGIALAIVIAMFALGVWAVQISGDAFTANVIVQDFSQSLEGAEQGDVHISFGVGELNVTALDDPDLLASGTVGVFENLTFEQKFDLRNETAYLEINEHGEFHFPQWPFGQENRLQWQINLTNSVPLDLEVDTGVGQSTIDLRGLQITSLSVDTGVGETVVYLPAEGNFRATVNGGVGELRVYVPSGTPVRLHLDSGLGNTSIVGDFQPVNQGDDAIDLYVSGGVGNVSVIELDN